MKPRLFTHQTTLEERLAEEAKQLREKAKMLPPGPVRDAVIKKARQDETASHVFEWINSPGLKPPKGLNSLVDGQKP